MRPRLGCPPAAALFLVASLAVPASAQERPVEEADLPGGQTQTDEGRLYDSLVAQFQREYLRFTALLQVAPTIPFEEAEGNEGRIEIAAARFGIGGRLGGGVGYRLQTEFARSPAVLDVYISYGSDDVRVVVGRQKAPFSYEFLTSAADIPFVNRSRAVRALAPGREVGVEVQATSASSPLSLRAGVFNATQRRTAQGAPVSQAQRGGVLVVGRAQGAFDVGGGGALTVGTNVGYDTPDTSDEVEAPGRFLLGADARFRLGALLLSGEYLYARTGEAVRPLPRDREGGYATVGYDLSADDRVLARLDVFEGSEEVLFGYNRALTRAASFQANLVVPLDDAAEPFGALANFQLAF